MASKNLVVILSDEHQARAMRCAGHPFVQTPHLDALAARGTRFTNCVTPSPICVPARAAFATGRYPHQIGLWDNAMPYTGTPRSWGHVLQDAGIGCTSIGKLHYRNASDDVGFDEQIAPMHVVDGVGMVWASIREESVRVTGTGRMLGKHIGSGDSKYTDYDAAVTRKAIDWLHSRTDDQPFCLYIGLVAPHFPLVVPNEFYSLYENTDFGPDKLHPSDGYRRHPWIEKQNVMMDSEAKFRDADERRAAQIAYFGLCSWLDHNIGQILSALDASGLSQDTTVIYSSDHGDNVGARGLWGKSNFYEESVSVPMIVARPGDSAAICDTPVSLLDLSATIPDHFGLGDTFGEGTSLYRIAGAGPDPDRLQFSEYHAAGAVTGGFMVRTGRWKYIHYHGFAPELFDMINDPEECRDLAADPDAADVVTRMDAVLRTICDPDAVNAQAFADQAAMIAAYGGREAALKLGAPGATPPPKV